MPGRLAAHARAVVQGRHTKVWSRGALRRYPAVPYDFRRGTSEHASAHADPRAEARGSTADAPNASAARSAARRPARDAAARLRAVDRTLGLAQAALAQATTNRRPLLRLPWRQVRDRSRRYGQPRTLVMARSRDKSAGPRGHGFDRRQERARPGVHD